MNDEDMIKRVEQYMDDNHMLDRHMHVIVGVSGGADSMCLLFVLMRQAKKHFIELTAVRRRRQGAGFDMNVLNRCFSKRGQPGLLWRTTKMMLPRLCL